MVFEEKSTLTFRLQILWRWLLPLFPRSPRLSLIPSFLLFSSNKSVSIGFLTLFRSSFYRANGEIQPMVDKQFSPFEASVRVKQNVPSRDRFLRLQHFIRIWSSTSVNISLRVPPLCPGKERRTCAHSSTKEVFWMGLAMLEVNLNWWMWWEKSGSFWM